MPVRYRMCKLTRTTRRPYHQYLTVVGKSNFDVGKRFSQTPRLAIADAAQGCSTTLRGAIGSKQRDADQLEKMHDARPHRRASVSDVFDPAAEGLFHGLIERGF